MSLPVVGLVRNRNVTAVLAVQMGGLVRGGGRGIACGGWVSTRVVRGVVAVAVRMAVAVGVRGVGVVLRAMVVVHYFETRRSVNGSIASRLLCHLVSVNKIVLPPFSASANNNDP